MANEAAIALENARLYEEARKLADRDPLTGFYNHRFLHERMAGGACLTGGRGARPASRNYRAKNISSRWGCVMRELGWRSCRSPAVFSPHEKPA